MKKRNLLDQVAREIEKCVVCKKNKLGKPVAGEGSANAKILFVGEAPGKTESQTGRPFVGRSGKLLTKLIESIGLTREDVYITSPVKYYPVDKNGKGRMPTDAEIAHGNIHFQKQIQIIKPKIIVLLGKVAAKAVLGKDIFINGSHGTTIEQNNKVYFLTYHPAAAVRFVKFKKVLEADFQKLQKLFS